MEKIENIYNISISESELNSILLCVKCTIRHYQNAIDEQYKLIDTPDGDEARWCITNNTRKLGELEKIARELKEIQEG